MGLIKRLKRVFNILEDLDEPWNRSIIMCLKHDCANHSALCFDCIKKQIIIGVHGECQDYIKKERKGR